ncbi:MAG: hypothetical protein ACRCUY_11510 [Thermoguttaceae bacterium]
MSSTPNGVQMHHSPEFRFVTILLQLAMLFWRGSFALTDIIGMFLN